MIHAELEFDLQRHDRTLTEPNEAFDSDRDGGWKNECPLHGPKIRTNSEVLLFCFRPCDPAFAPKNHGSNPNNELLAAVVNIAHNLHEMCGSLELTVAVDDIPQLKSALFTGVFDVITLHHIQGWVVWAFEGLSERNGVINFRGRMVRSG